MQELKAKLVAKQADLESEARKAAPAIEQAYAQKNPLCQNGQLDPAYARRETEKEWSRVIDFVKNQQDVRRETGGIKDIYRDTFTKKSTEVMPYRYEMSVIGNDGKRIHPIIEVDRTGGEAKFTLKCISHPGRREAGKDECTQ